MQIKFNSSDRLLIVQFDFSNYEALPFKLPNLGKETIAESQRRRATAKTNAVSTRLADFGQKQIFAAYMPISLYTSGYVLVDAQHRERVDKHDTSTSYNAIRYTFVRKEFERKDDQKLQEFLPFRGVHYAGFQELCELALWGKLRVYRNPFFKDGVEISGQHAISLNLDARKPLFESGNSARTYVPEIEPDLELVIVNNTLMLDLFQN